MLRLRLLLPLLLAFSVSALPAAEGKKKKSAPAPAPARQGPQPSLRLEPLVKKMDAALVLFDGDDKRPDHVPNEAAVLRAEFAGQYTASETDKDRAVFDAAMVVCDRIAFANEERRKMKSRIASGGAAPGKGKGKAAPKKKYKDPDKARQAKDDKFFFDQLRAEWKLKRNDLLDQINKTFLKLKEAEVRARE